MHGAVKFLKIGLPTTDRKQKILIRTKKYLTIIIIIICTTYIHTVQYSIIRDTICTAIINIYLYNTTPHTYTHYRHPKTIFLLYYE